MDTVKFPNEVSPDLGYQSDGQDFRAGEDSSERHPGRIRMGLLAEFEVQVFRGWHGSSWHIGRALYPSRAAWRGFWSSIRWLWIDSGAAVRAGGRSRPAPVLPKLLLS